jgi:hypothetical protein
MIKSAYTLEQREKDLRLIRKYNSSFYSFLRRIPIVRSYITPAPPFDIGDKVTCVSISGVYGFEYGKEYTVFSMYLSNCGGIWYVRTLEKPSSTWAADFVLSKDFNKVIDINESLFRYPKDISLYEVCF